MSEETKNNEEIQETVEEKAEEVTSETPENNEKTEPAENAETAAPAESDEPAAPAEAADTSAAVSRTDEADTSKEKPESETRTRTPDSRTPDTRRRDDSQNRGQRGERGGPSQRFPRFRKKVCRFCENPEIKIDYKNPDLLERFITERGKILPRRITGTCARHQRQLATAIKQSRTIALLPFVVK